MLDTVIFDPFIRVRPYSKSLTIGKVMPKVRLVHHTDPMFDTPIFQAFIQDNSIGCIHIRKWFSMKPNRDYHRTFREGFVYWKKIVMYKAKCNICLRYLPTKYFVQNMHKSSEINSTCKDCHEKLALNRKNILPIRV